ncbi:hypothetical protein BC832DRAFT_134872 [Gaertneriomyces semiglobifer]|nr:hypothetical protein BC832DRAFT_134872 [Gaertneriomyces semiglobifer]
MWSSPIYRPSNPWETTYSLSYSRKLPTERYIEGHPTASCSHVPVTVSVVDETPDFKRREAHEMDHIQAEPNARERSIRSPSPTARHLPDSQHGQEFAQRLLHESTVETLPILVSTETQTPGADIRPTTAQLHTATTALTPTLHQPEVSYDEMPAFITLRDAVKRKTSTADRWQTEYMRQYIDWTPIMKQFNKLRGV